MPRWHHWVERVLPWFDRDAEDRRDEHTEALRQRSIAARISAERIRLDYEEAAEASRRARPRRT